MHINASHIGQHPPSLQTRVVFQTYDELGHLQAHRLTFVDSSVDGTCPLFAAILQPRGDLNICYKSAIKGVQCGNGTNIIGEAREASMVGWARSDIGSAVELGISNLWFQDGICFTHFRLYVVSVSNRSSRTGCESMAPIPLRILSRRNHPTTHNPFAALLH